MELNIDSFMTPKGVLSILAALSVVCSFMLTAPVIVIAQQYSGAPYGGYTAGDVQQVTIPGLEGLTGFVSGENGLSLATYLASQDGDRLYFQVVGMAISSPYSPQSTVYTMSQPLTGVLDRSANTIQIDMSGLAASISNAGTVDKADLYDALRSNENVFVINLDAVYHGLEQRTDALRGGQRIRHIARRQPADLFAPAAYAARHRHGDLPHELPGVPGAGGRPLFRLQ